MNEAESIYRGAMALLAQAEQAADQGEYESVVAFLGPLSECIEALVAVSGDLDTKIVVKCRLAELQARRLRDQIAESAGPQWMAVQARFTQPN